MKIGAIDIGTNSMRLLIADYTDGRISNQRKYVNTTRIGQDVDSEGVISPEAINRNIEALREFYNMSHKCSKVYCIATSALRDAKNGCDFVKLAKKVVDIDVDIISGEEESLLGFRGVIEGIKQKEDILVLDIGGGSTEFILGSHNKIDFMKSENIGALRLTEKFIKNDPVTPKELEETKEYIQKNIEDTINHLKSKNIKQVVGIGGTITSISAMNQELEVYSMEKIQNSVIYQKDIDNILQKLIKMTLSDKKQLKGLQPKRADIIMSGVIILDMIVKSLEIDKILVSEYDNLEGLICKKVKTMS